MEKRLAANKGPTLTMRRPLRWGTALAALVLLMPSVAARAADAPRGFTVSPAFQSVAVPGKGGADFVVGITNNTPADQNFKIVVQDFGTLDETGGVAFLGQPSSELEHKYGLASWLKLGSDTIFVPSGGSVQIPVTVENRESLAPGGHYGAVLATAVDDFGKPIADPRVGLKQVLASLVLAVKDGGIKRELKLVGQETNGGWGRLPTEAEQRFGNTGNVHLIPRGVTEVTDAAGRVVARGALNDESASILPESFRRYKTPLMGVKRAWLPGRYQVLTTYRADGIDKPQTVSTSFWYAGALIVWAVLAGALGAAGVLAWWLWVRPRRRKK